MKFFDLFVKTTILLCMTFFTTFVTSNVFEILVGTGFGLQSWLGSSRISLFGVFAVFVFIERCFGGVVGIV